MYVLHVHTCVCVCIYMNQYLSYNVFRTFNKYLVNEGSPRVKVLQDILGYIQDILQD